MSRTYFTRGALSGVASGAPKLIQAIFGGGGDKAYQEGYDKSALAQSRIAHAVAAAGKSEAQAENERAKTAAITRRPELYEEQAALASGFDIPTVQAVRQVAAGKAPTVPMGPPTESGDMGVGSFKISPEGKSKISMALQQYLPLMTNSGDLKPDDLAQSYKIFSEAGLRDDVIAGRLPAGDVAEAQRAMRGGDLFKQAGNGSVLDVISGEVDQTNPIATATADAKNAQATKALRPPVSRASSGSSTSGASGKAPSGYQWTTGQDGAIALKAIPGGPADPSVKSAGPSGGMKIPAEVQRMNVALRSLDEGLTAYQNLLKDFDPRSPAQQIDPETRANAKSLIADLRLQLKEAQALGALTGPDVGILDQALSDPATLRGAFYGRSGLGAQLTQTRASLKRRRKAIDDEFGLTPTQVTAPTQPTQPATTRPPLSSFSGGARPPLSSFGR